jgi:hypothetical protein
MYSMDCGESGYIYNQFVMYANGNRVVLYANSKLGLNTLECVAEGTCALNNGLVTYTVDKTICFNNSPTPSSCGTSAVLRMLNFGIRKLSNGTVKLDETAFYKSLANGASDRAMNVMHKILSARHDY